MNCRNGLTIINKILPVKLKSIYPLILFLSLFLLSGCLFQQGPSGDLVWVVKTVSGGEQCKKDNDYTPPDIRYELEQHGVRVYDTGKEQLSTCSACGCPTYAAHHFAKIEQNDVGLAAEIGYRRTERIPNE